MFAKRTVVKFAESFYPAGEGDASTNETIDPPTTRDPAMSQFDIVREEGTNGINYDITNDDIIRQLTAWHDAYGIEISDVGHDRVNVTFQSLPDDLDALAAEIYEFCPDVVDQHFGCMDDMIDQMAEIGQDVSDELAELVDGVDFQDEDFGLTLLKKSLRMTQQVPLWWD